MNQLKRVVEMLFTHAGCQIADQYLRGSAEEVTSKLF
jgi:hypothetical protein